MSRRILFVMRHSGFVRNFETAIGELARRGHRIHLAFELAREQAEVAEALAARYPRSVTFGPAPVRSDVWQHLAFELRTGIDALRYRTPDYASAPKLQERGLRGAPVAVRLATAPGLGRTRAVLTGIDRALRRAAAALPPDRAIESFLDEQAPDLLLVTPLVAGPTQDDIVRAARRRGVPVGLPVTSWDNLTNKGLIRETVDRVLVWNEPQRQEAQRFHGVPTERVAATGAHTYDHWFTWTPSTTRERFCERVGLSPDRPIVLYLGSSKFIAPREPEFVQRWLAGIREQANEPLRSASVLLRPHPATGRLWRDVELDPHGAVAVWPRVGADPRDETAKRDYFDTMFHAKAAVGINTSALIELAIVGRPAFTLLAPEFRDTQEGTLHFSHLTSTAGGILTVARSVDEHHDQLAAAMAADGPPSSREAFLRAFVRPFGLDVPAAPRFAAEVEALTVTAPLPIPRHSDALVRAVLRPLAAATGTSGRKAPVRRRIERRWRRARVAKRLRRRIRRTRRRLERSLRHG